MHRPICEHSLEPLMVMGKSCHDGKTQLEPYTEIIFAGVDIVANELYHRYWDPLDTIG